MESLVAPRYDGSHFYSKPQVADSVSLRGLTLLEPLVPASDGVRGVSSSSSSSRSFRLLGLPIEIQNLIYSYYFGQWSVTLDYKRYSMLRSRVVVHGVPSTQLLLVSRYVARVANEVRMKCFTGRLILNSVFVLVTLRKKAEFDWLRSHVRILHFSDSSVRPERWYRYYESFVGLARLEIDFPKLVRLDDRDCLDVERMLRGERDDVLLTANLEDFRTSLIGELGRSLMVVVSQTYCLSERLFSEGWHGILHAQIQLSESCARVLERTHDPEADTVSKRQFQIMHEL